MFRSLKSFLSFFLVLIVLMFTALTVRADEFGIAKGQLEGTLAALSSLESQVERQDLARIFILKQITQETLTSLEQNGMGHSRTYQSYQVMIIRFRYSADFFTNIITDSTKNAIAKLESIQKQIVKDRGFDDSPYTQITASVFSQMHSLMRDLTKQDITAELKEKLNHLVAPIGELIAVAKQGDRPKTFEKATPISKKVSEMYVDFDDVSMSHPSFNIIMSIQGLNEFYAEFAQINN